MPEHVFSPDTKPLLLSLIPLGRQGQGVIGEAAAALGLELQVAAKREQRDAKIAADGSRVRVLLSNGTTGLSSAEIDVMPALELIGAFGVGYERIAVQTARQRGISVVNGAGSNADCVADHALGLLLGVIRGLRQQDIATRNGIWRDAVPLYPQLAGKRVGIVGFGAVGNKIAQRVSAFNAEVSYHSRTPRAESPLRHFADVTALAEWCDHLIVATPGGAATQHLIDAAVLSKMNKRGCLVNIARGSVVDTAALANVLREGRLGGAGLDVYESEPEPPHELFEFANVMFTPHVAGTSPEAIAAAVELFVGNLQRHMAGEDLLTPVL